MLLTIDKEFESLIPALTNEEYLQLEENLVQNGIREPLSVWGDVLIDGHNRYYIAQKHGLKYTTKEYEFENRNDVIFWIIKNQFGRRNISIYDRSVLALRLKPIIAEQAKMRMISGEKIDPSHIYDKGRANDKIGELAQVSRGTIDKVEKIEAQAVPEIKNKIKSGDLTINQAYKAIKREEKQKSISEQIKPESESISIDIHNCNKKYRIIYADPCWSYGDKCEDGGIQSRGASGVYPTMSIKELCDLPVKNISEDNAALFIWVTSPLLSECFDVIEAWGFKYKSSFVWDKIKHNMGHYNSVRHEFLLICTKGSCTPDNVKLFDSVQSIERTEHSRKPEEFRKIIDTLYPHGERLEMFSRISVEKWDMWGNMI